MQRKLQQVTVDFQPMDEQDLEYILSDEYNPTIPHDRTFEVITSEEAGEHFFDKQPSSVPIYVVVGGQKGDESKGKVTERADSDFFTTTHALPDRLLQHLMTSIVDYTKMQGIQDPTSSVEMHIKGWTLAPNSTHNAGKGIHTVDQDGKPVRFSQHLCPATLANPNTLNFIGRNTQLNLFKLIEEVETCISNTGRDKLGEDYYLMVDRHANLVLPTDRVLDVVCKINAMNSTLSGATASYKHAAGKEAPTLQSVLYDEENFRSCVEKQLREFRDFLQHDTDWRKLGITDFPSLGSALQNEGFNDKGKRLETLRAKLSQEEKDFFTQGENPEGYLLTQYQGLIEKNLFVIGDAQQTIDTLIDQNVPGTIEGVQSVLLSGGVKYSNNRTAAHTHSSGTIGDAGLTAENIAYQNLLVFKFANTSVGGLERTMSGHIRQDRLSTLQATLPSGEKVDFEYTKTVEKIFSSQEEAYTAFQEVNRLFTTAIQNGYSLRHSRVKFNNLEQDFSLAQARAILNAYIWNETGETSKRSRTCRDDDLVESGVVFGIEGSPLLVWNAVDRATDLDTINLITGYQVTQPYMRKQPGDVILPGEPLLREQLTVNACIPIMTQLPSWDRVFEDHPTERGSKVTHPHLTNYLLLMAQGREVMALGDGPKPENLHYVKETVV